MLGIIGLAVALGSLVVGILQLKRMGRPPSAALSAPQVTSLSDLQTRKKTPDGDRVRLDKAFWDLQLANGLIREMRDFVAAGPGAPSWFAGSTQENRDRFLANLVARRYQIGDRISNLPTTHETVRNTLVWIERFDEAVDQFRRIHGTGK